MKKRMHTSCSTLKADKDTHKKVVIGLVQIGVSDNIAENMKKTQRKIVEAAQKGAQIICLQELYRTKYFPQQEKKCFENLAETIPGQSTTIFSQLAKENNIVIIAPIFEKSSDGKFYNSAVIIDIDGKIVGVYHKVHIPHDPYFYEKDYFAQGENIFQVYETTFARIGVLICYDQWFPEPARIISLLGAEIIFYPTAIGYIKGHTSEDGNWHDAWKTVQRTHAITNGVHVAAVNRVGEEGELEFWGGSFVCDSFGVILAEASTTKEELLIVEIDLSKNESIKEGWGFLRNRRPDKYNLLTEKTMSEPTNE